MKKLVSGFNAQGGCGRDLSRSPPYCRSVTERKRLGKALLFRERELWQDDWSALEGRKKIKTNTQRINKKIKRERNCPSILVDEMTETRGK